MLIYCYYYWGEEIVRGEGERNVNAQRGPLAEEGKERWLLWRQRKWGEQFVVVVVLPLLVYT